MIESKKTMIIVNVLLTMLGIFALSFGCPIVILLIYFYLSIYYGFKNNEETIIAYIILAVFQNIILIIFSDNISNIENTIFSLMKEFMLYFALFVAIIRNYKNIKLDKLYILSILFILIIAISLLLTPASFISSIVSIRQFLIVILGLILGKSLKLNKKGKQKLLFYFIVVCIVLCVFGLIDLFITDNAIWKNLNFKQFLLNKHPNRLHQLYEGVTANFYTWIGKLRLRRLVSITADPLATGHLLFLGLLLVIMRIYSKLKDKIKAEKKDYVILVLFFICSVLVLSKGVYMYMAITFLFLLYDRFGESISKKMFLFIIVMSATSVIVLILYSYIFVNGPTAITNHVDGLLNGFKNATLLGNGLGTQGFAVSSFTGNRGTTSESFIGILIDQLGYVGFSVFVAIIFLIGYRMIKVYLECKDLSVLTATIVLVGMIGDMLFSESSVSAIGTMIYFIFIGYVYFNKCHNISMYKKEDVDI